MNTDPVVSVFIANATWLACHFGKGIGMGIAYLYFLTRFSTWIHGVGNCCVVQTLNWGGNSPMVPYFGAI